MNTCGRQPHTQRSAANELETRRSGVAWICRDCNRMHIGTEDNATGVVMMRRVEDGIIRYSDGGSIEGLSR